MHALLKENFISSQALNNISILKFSHNENSKKMLYGFRISANNAKKISVM